MCEKNNIKDTIKIINMKNIIILIIASDNTDEYIQMQNIWERYMNNHTNITSFFIKNTNTIDEDIFLENNTIYVKGDETVIPGIFNKTIKSIEYCNKHFNYDFIYRTNLSSVLNLNKMYDFICNNDKIDYGGFIGIHNDIRFASGSGFFMSRDASICLCNYSKTINSYEYLDDVLIGKILNKIYPITFINRYDMQSLDDHTYDKNIFHYRCRFGNISLNIMENLYNILFSYENNCKYICSQGFRQLCNMTSLNNTNNVDEYDFTKLKEYDVLYIKTDALNDFSKKISNIQCKFILVTGSSDYSISVDVLCNSTEINNILENENLIHWYAENNIYSHPKISMLPIGLDYHTMYKHDIYWGSKKTPLEQENELIEIKRISKPFWDREIKIYSNCHFLTSTKFGGDRIDAINTIPNDLLYLELTQVDRITSWTKQINYAFVLSPHGNGLDCHRTWEALVLGCIPIVKKSAIDVLYDELPALIVNDWNEINVELLTNTIENFKNKNFNYERLTMKYWMEKIKNSR